MYQLYLEGVHWLMILMARHKAQKIRRHRLEDPGLLYDVWTHRRFTEKLSAILGIYIFVVGIPTTPKERCLLQTVLS